MFAGAYRRHCSPGPSEEQSLTPLHLKPGLFGLSHWAAIAHSHDLGLASHLSAVAQLTVQFSDYLGCSSKEQRVLRRAAFLHDIGKIRVPAPLLCKPGKLTGRELQIMQSHPWLGYELLSRAGEWNEVVLTVARDHHERLDGSGYPRGIGGSEIGFRVRLITICDVYCAMTEERPYAETMSWNLALERMSQKGTRLDMDLLDAFSTMITCHHSHRGTW
ncbi:HD-GYP domain-containing protein [Terriglobus albidus]|uniref:HD-GYP domain-containing protein n=1 Tax=Terriglobus albidus TaxID=1592106 RepID=UPI0037D9BE8C